MASYNAIDNPSPYGSGDPYYNASTGYITPANPKKPLNKWIKISIPIAILVTAGAVVAGVLASRHHNHNSSSSSSSSGSPAAASSALSAKNAVGIFPTGTDSEFMVPIYPSTTNAAAFTEPTFNPSNSGSGWPQDSFSPSNPSPTSLRPDRPRIIAPAYKWQALPKLIAQDAYLKSWNGTIFQNASDYYSLPPVTYFMDGSSGILDTARAVKMRIKAFSYAYRMSNDTKWADRAWVELQNAAGNGTTSFGPATDRWNSAHFLDAAEFCAAFGIGYDWLHDVLTDDQKSQIRFTMNEYCLNLGLAIYQGDPNGIGWWRNSVYGNWNCVCNSGLTLGALAILDDDTTGNAAALLGYTIPNANQNCVFGTGQDGTWNETANYWYFGTTAHAEMSSALMTAAGSDFNLLSTNPNFNLAGLYHLYVTGPTSLFNYGDCGPNKFSTTANSMMLYATQYNMPQYMLFQRDRPDAASDPWSMFWYNTLVSGAFWDGTPLDNYFNYTGDQWASMRSSWTDLNALFVAIKAGALVGHQNHNDLDNGDFVLDALATRWVGELGSGDYNSQEYFASDAQNATRWLYYRKRTEGQNTVLVNQQNQDVTAHPTVSYGSSGTKQGSSTVFEVPSGSTAYFVADLTSAYFNTVSFSRGVRLLNKRTQVLLQDEINAQGTVMWRIHTNATVAVSSNGTSATLTLDGQTLIMEMLNPPTGAQFSTGQAVRLSGDPALPSGQADQANPGVTVVSISLPAGQYNLQVLFNPQWPNLKASDYVTPSNVPLSQWSTTSHD